MRGVLNLSDVDEQGNYTLLPEGEYIVKITETVDKKTKKGDPMVAVKFTVAEGKYTSKWVWDNICFVPEILNRTKHFLHVIGQQYEGEEVPYDSDYWQDRELKITVKHEEYNGKTRARVARHDFLVEPESSVRPQDPLDDQDIPF